MTADASEQGRTELSVSEDLWSRVFTIAPLVLVGTIEEDGSHDLAPKHMAMPLGWGGWFAFACAPTHATQRNAQRTGAFTVSYPRPDQLIASSLAASPRAEDDSKPALAALETVPASRVEGVLVEGAHLWLECELDRVIEGYGENSLVTGRIVTASVADQAARRDDLDDAELLAAAPLLAYVAPRRFAEIGETRSFPFPADFRR